MNIYGPAELLTESHPSCAKSSYFLAPAKPSAAPDSSLGCTFVSRLWQIGHNRSVGVGEGSDQVLRRVGRFRDQMFPHVSHLGGGVYTRLVCVGICGGGLGVAGRVRRLFGPEWRWVAPGQICVHWLPTHFNPRLLPPPPRYTSTCPPPGWLAWRKAGAALGTSDSLGASRKVKRGKGVNKHGSSNLVKPLSAIFRTDSQLCVSHFNCGS